MKIYNKQLFFIGIEENELANEYAVIVESYGKICELIVDPPHKLIVDNFEWHASLLRRLLGNKLLTWN